MFTIRQLSLNLLWLSLALVSVSAQNQTTSNQQQPTTATSIIIERQLVRFTTLGEAVEWHLIVTNQQAEVIFDSGLLYATALEWPLKNQQEEAIQSGLYAYTLTTKAVNDEAPRTQRGHLILNRAGSASDQVWVTNDSAVGLGADGDRSRLTVVGSGETTFGGVELPVVAPRREASEERPELPKRASAETATEKTAGPAAVNGTANQVPKFAADGTSLIDSSIRDVGGQVSINSPLMVGTNGGAFGRLHVVEPASTIVETLFFENNSTANVTTKGTGIGFYGRDTINSLKNTGRIAVLPVDSNWIDSYLAFCTRGSDALGERVRITSSGNVGIGTTNPLAKLQVAGDIQSLALWQQLTAYTPNVIGGFVGTSGQFSVLGNRATPGVVGATIGGGGYNGTITFPTFGTLQGDNSNLVTDWFGTVAGGLNNRAGNNSGTLDDARFATVGGGFFNTSSGYSATVGGGYFNTSSAYYATVGGGYGNHASTDFAIVGGGYNNSAIGKSATVGGGDSNGAIGSSATVGGGFFNQANGNYATVPGGYSNAAQGDYSFAAGQLARVNHQGTFAWADFTNAIFASTGDNQFLIRASGGVGIGLNNPAEQLHVSGNIRATGNVCAANLACASDARLKKQVTNLRYGLPHLLQLRPVSWQWKDPTMQQLPMGLIAQEVEDVIPELILRDADPAKPLGLNYLGLVPVVIKAIQEQQATITTLKAENAALNARLAALEEVLQQFKQQRAQAQPAKLQREQP